jgi:hypothetical protein
MSPAFAAVGEIRLARCQSRVNHAIPRLHRRVVLDQQVVGDLSDANAVRTRQPLDRRESVMLTRDQTGRFRLGPFTLDGTGLLQFTAELLHGSAAERNMEPAAKDNGEPVRPIRQHTFCDEQVCLISNCLIDPLHDVIRELVARKRLDPSVKPRRGQDFPVGDLRLSFKKQLLQISHGCVLLRHCLCTGHTVEDSGKNRRSPGPVILSISPAAPAGGLGAPPH